MISALSTRSLIRLRFGVAALVVLCVGILLLALMIPGYSHVQQTVSEIGEVGSPAKFPFALMLIAVAACVLIFASGVRDVSGAAAASLLPAYLIAAMGVSIVGVALFPHPHTLHNVFGISELVGYQAPLAFAIVWRRKPDARALAALSLIFYAAIVVLIALNLSSMFSSTLWSYVQPRYGLIQRALFGAWFIWSALLGVVLGNHVLRARRKSESAVTARTN